MVLEGRPRAGRCGGGADARGDRRFTDGLPTASIPVTVSIGVSALEETSNRKVATVETLLQQADQRLYASKAAGRNRVSGPEPASLSVVQRK